MMGADGSGISVSGACEGDDVLSEIPERDDLIHKAPVCTIDGSRFPVILLGKLVHLIDDRLDRFARILLLP